MSETTAGQAARAPGSRYLDPRTLQRIGDLDVAARTIVEGLRIGGHRSPLRGFSTEFDQHRQYVPGDPLRHVDWRVFGRTERFYVKMYEAETNFDANLLLDASRSMRYRSATLSKLEYAKHLAASLAYLIAEQRDAVGLAVFDDRVRDYIEPRSSPAVVRDIAAMLQRAEGGPRTDVAAILHEFARRIPRRGVVLLFSDLLDAEHGLLRGLEHLRFRGHDVALFHTLDPAELRFEFDGSRRFVGVEHPESLAAEPRRIRRAYLRELRRFLADVRGDCEKAGVDYTLVDTSQPLEVVLCRYLETRRAGRLRS